MAAHGPVLRFGVVDTAVRGAPAVCEYVRRPSDVHSVFVRRIARSAAERAGIRVLSSTQADLLGWF